MRIVWVLGLGLVACKGGDGGSDLRCGDDMDEPCEEEDTGDADDAPEVQCTEPAAMACEDAMILDLGLQDNASSSGAVLNTADGTDWITHVDATAGGAGNAHNNPWVYVRFTEDGAERVDIDDESALYDMSWHIAARRFILRLNSGSSGPSCVSAVPFLEKGYDELNEVPDGLNWTVDNYYTSDCTLINDSSGLPGSPQTALAPWWSYSQCVATTGVPFLIQLDDGRVVKFEVEAYYGTDQEVCNSTGSGGGSSAEYTWRWAFMD